MLISHEEHIRYREYWYLDKKDVHVNRISAYVNNVHMMRQYRNAAHSFTTQLYSHATRTQITESSFVVTVVGDKLSLRCCCLRSRLNSHHLSHTHRGEWQLANDAPWNKEPIKQSQAFAIFGQYGRVLRTKSIAFNRPNWLLDFNAPQHFYLG